MKIATWNVNSVKARIGTVMDWLKEAAPDVACLQEIKTTDEGFPRMELEDLGYNIETHGQKSYNGVAILSKFPMSDVTRGLPGGDQPKVLFCTIETRPDRIAEALAAGADDYVMKPFDGEILQSKLAEVGAIAA